jgi:hypothetical protein
MMDIGWTDSFKKKEWGDGIQINSKPDRAHSIKLQ